MSERINTNFTTTKVLIESFLLEVNIREIVLLGKLFLPDYFQCPEFHQIRVGKFQQGNLVALRKEFYEILVGPGKIACKKGAMLF